MLQIVTLACSITTRRAVLAGAGSVAIAPPATATASSANAALQSTRYPSALKLADGSLFPYASFGLQIYDNDTAERLTLAAIEAGFRNFFASVLANNQRGFAKAVKRCGVPRDELFICGSVVSNRAFDEESAYQLTKLGCKENMEAFAVGGITELDMIMLDYPGPDKSCIRGQWRAFEEMKAAGLVRSLAVSNFTPQQLDYICADKGSTRPMVNQLPLCVGYHDPGIVKANGRRGVHVQAWSPLGNGRLTRFSRDAKMTKAACAEIGAKYGKSAYQVALRWLTQTNTSFTVEARSADHFGEDISIFDFELSDADLAALEMLNVQPETEGSVTGPDV